MTEDRWVVAIKPIQIPNPTNIPSIDELTPRKPISKENKKHKTNEFMKDKTNVFSSIFVFLVASFEYFNHCLPKTKGEYHKKPIAI